LNTEASLFPWVPFQASAPFHLFPEILVGRDPNPQPKHHLHHTQHTQTLGRDLGVGVSIPSRTSQAYSQGPSSRLGSPFMTVHDYLILAYISIGALTIFVLWVAVRVFRRGG